ncbi:MAG: c-type cytochrome [Myxococcota bacterium]
MSRVAKIGGGLVLALLLGAGGTYAWATSARDAVLAQTYETHRVDFPIPFPLTETELAELRAQKLAEAAPPADPNAPATATDAAAEPVADPLAGTDLDAIARERAIARGKHLVESRYVCIECHGADFGGGTMIDDPAVGRLLGANLTTGKGSRTLSYTASDWDRMVRHGVKPDGKASPMPSKDFFAVSDRELSDIVTYIRSLPPVDKESPEMEYGPVLTMLLATGQVGISAQELPDHQKAHAVDPPAEAVDATFGQHVIQVCTGCHGADLAGGPIVGAPPDWPPASNLTPAGLKDWKFEDFEKTMKSGTRPDGTPLKPPMDGMARYAAKMSDTELRAMWTYLGTLPPTPSKQ